MIELDHIGHELREVARLSGHTAFECTVPGCNMGLTIEPGRVTGMAYTHACAGKARYLLAQFPAPEGECPQP